MAVMATRALIARNLTSRLRYRLLSTSNANIACEENEHQEWRGQKSTFPVHLVGCGILVGVAWISYKKHSTYGQSFVPLPVIEAATNVKKEEEQEKKKAALHAARESRFQSFASVEYRGIVYMTPEDFLASVTDEVPRPRTHRLQLRSDEVERMLKTAPVKRRSSSHMFRDLRNQGLISYTEYLFLVCVLTKPQSGFQIAFNMFDTDGNSRVDKEEFLVVQQLMSGNIPSKDLLRSILARISDKLLLPEEERDRTIPEIQDTTLAVHFFGTRGRDALSYEDFYKFTDNLQTEVWEMEFNEYSKGKPTIGEDEFARILLRYTILTDEEVSEYIERMRSRIPRSKGITFEDFKNFCRFLNSLDDFAVAMRLYTIADIPISQEDFKRAVTACTGKSLDPHLINTMFQLFDVDGDDHLSHKEFVSVMRDRLHRGFKHQTLTPATGWEGFRKCVAHHLKHDR